LVIENISNNAWTDGPSMSTTRDAFGCAVAGGALFAVGGESDATPFTLAGLGGAARPVGRRRIVDRGTEKL
jgi:hypothetical protein